jgi:two-component system sensor histidine kinase PhoQ
MPEPARSPPRIRAAGSLHGRLLLAATLTLTGFLGATGAALYNAFRDSAEAGLRERLLGYAYALLAAADEDRDGRLLLPRALPDPRFSNPESGVYALVRSTDGRFAWRSPSLTGRDGDFLRPQPPGTQAYHDQTLGELQVQVINFGIAWEDYLGSARHYTLAVASDTAPLLAEVAGFRSALWTWLGGLALALLLAQALILRWGLAPLRRVAADLRRIEAGRADRLEGAYPRELRGLTASLNALIASSQASQQRYRNSLGDLAHSLKTPLAILRNAADGDPPRDFRATVSEQVQRMDGIVQHQLRRAAAAGPGGLGRALPVAPQAERLARSLAKVYRDKALSLEQALDPGARFFGDEGDLLEVLGNLMDNACKYGRSRLRITAAPLAAPGSGRAGLLLRVEDDGPGIDPARAPEVLQRGRRMDQSMPGQGLGLSVAADIVAVYGGQIGIGSSALGGAALEVRFPAS